MTTSKVVWTTDYCICTSIKYGLIPPTKNNLFFVYVEGRSQKQVKIKIVKLSVTVSSIGKVVLVYEV